MIRDKYKYNKLKYIIIIKSYFIYLEATKVTRVFKLLLNFNLGI